MKDKNKDENNDKVINVDGPLNIVRLEGNIGKNKKVIYLFMDVHNNLTTETQCASIDSINVKNYIYDELLSNDKKSSKIVDVFIENGFGTDQLKDNLNYIHSRKIYIDNIINFFYINSQHNAKYIKNVRYHDIDPRKFLSNIFDTFKGVRQKIYEILDPRYVYDDIKLYHNMIHDLITEHKINVNSVCEILKNNKNNSDKNNTNNTDNADNADNVDDAIQSFINKLRNSYNNDNVKKIMNKLLDDSIDMLLIGNKLLDNMLDLLEKHKNNNLMPLNKINREYPFYHGIDCIKNIQYTSFDFGPNYLEIKKFANEMESLLDAYYRHICTKYMCIVMDVNLLRRFLDKEYVTNCVVYTGASHSIYYIINLVKYFNFKITHIGKHDENDNKENINSEIEKFIHNTKNFNECSQYVNEHLIPNQLQCTTLHNFPSCFE